MQDNDENEVWVQFRQIYYICINEGDLSKILKETVSLYGCPS